jgi:hypothetical protein
MAATAERLRGGQTVKRKERANACESIPRKNSAERSRRLKRLKKGKISIKATCASQTILSTHISRGCR